MSKENALVCYQRVKGTIISAESFKSKHSTKYRQYNFMKSEHSMEGIKREKGNNSYSCLATWLSNNDAFAAFVSRGMANDEQKLHLAVRNQDKESIERLLDSGVDVNCMFYGWTPLQFALQRGTQFVYVSNFL